MGPDEGDGSEIEMHLYYDAAEDRCVPFKYTGQGGNQNRFSSERTCMRNCSANAENVYPVNGRRTSLNPSDPFVLRRQCVTVSRHVTKSAHFLGVSEDFGTVSD